MKAEFPRNLTLNFGLRRLPDGRHELELSFHVKDSGPTKGSGIGWCVKSNFSYVIWETPSWRKVHVDTFLKMNLEEKPPQRLEGLREHVWEFSRVCRREFNRAVSSNTRKHELLKE